MGREEKNKKSEKMEVDDALTDEIMQMTTDDINFRTQMLDNECKIMRSEFGRITHEVNDMKLSIKGNADKVNPYLVANIIELLDLEDEQEEEEGAMKDVSLEETGKCAVVKTSTRQTFFLPVIGLVPQNELTPGDLVGVNKDSYLVLEKLPVEYDSRVKGFEVDEKPTEQYSDIGGLDKFKNWSKLLSC